MGTGAHALSSFWGKNGEAWPKDLKNDDLWDSAWEATCTAWANLNNEERLDQCLKSVLVNLLKCLGQCESSKVSLVLIRTAIG